MEIMRRIDKEIIDRSAIEAIIEASFVCRLALSDGEQPYIVPLCFGYHDMTLFFHGAQEGTKIDLIRKNNKVCFEFDLNAEAVEDEKACGWGVRYRSVIGFGKAFLLDNFKEKQRALDTIFSHYSEKKPQMTEKAIKATAVIKVVIEKIFGKQSGY